MKINNLECITHMQLSCKSQRRNGFKVISMQDQISSRDAEKSQKILTSRRKPGSIYADTSLEFIKACEELNWNHERSTPHRSETWNCRASCTTSERTIFVSVGSVWIARKLVGRSHGASLLPPSVQDLLGDGQMPLWTTVQFTTWTAEYSNWSTSNILFNIIRRTRSNASLRHKSPSWNFHWVRFESGWKLDWWSFHCGYGGSVNNSTIWNSCKKIQIKRSGHCQETRWICIPMQHGRNLARGTAFIYRYLQNGRRHYEGISA